MGGAGSTRWRLHSAKDTVEECLCLSLTKLIKDGYFTPGNEYSLTWQRYDGSTRGSIGLQVDSGSILLKYYINGQQMRESVDITRTRTSFGERRYFVCPECGDRALKLYLATWRDNRFLCRKCLDLAYECQREAEHFRLLRKAQKIRQRAGGTGNTLISFPPRPKGMHRSTYYRLRTQGADVESRMWGAAAVKLHLNKQ